MRGYTLSLQRSRVALEETSGSSAPMWVYLGLVRKGQSEQEEKAPKEGLTETLSQVSISSISLLRKCAWLVVF